MDIIDLHCDALYRALTESVRLDSDGLETKLNCTNHKLQCYAIWFPDGLSGSEAEKMLLRSHKLLTNECKRLRIKLINPKESAERGFYNNLNSAFFTIENALPINGRLENVELISRLGVRMMTLTWNGANEIGGGAETNGGITKFGKAVVAEMEKHRIIVDISHASPKLFYDVAQIAKRPFVASHSNSFKITGHRRNLTDEQFQIIKKSGGLVGLNFHNEFLNDNPEKSGVYDVLRHAEHFLSLGGENTICFGSDFDGGTLPKDITDSRVYDKIYEIFLRKNYKESLINKIFCGNALKFFESFDNQ